jgi:hypothetical protein
MRVFCVLNQLYMCLEFHQDHQTEAIGITQHIFRIKTNLLSALFQHSKFF